MREDTAHERDRAAQERDEQAARRDREAERQDAAVRELELSEAALDRHVLRLQELRDCGAKARRRAALDRERAAADRRQAARDREEAALDRALAATDELTGARRRGVGLEELERELDRSRRTATSFVAVFVDVDDLKSVNDRHGHAAGDELLRQVVVGLRRHLRSYDLIVRVGGDEFLCGLPGVTLAQARSRFADLGASFTAAAGSSVSFGLAQMRDGEELLELAERADRDLLAARGR